MLKSKYIICSIDKASSNFSFICKKFYVQTLVNEMGFDNITLDSIGNDTYKPCSEDESFMLIKYLIF